MLWGCSPSATSTMGERMPTSACSMYERLRQCKQEMSRKSKLSLVCYGFLRAFVGAIGSIGGHTDTHRHCFGNLIMDLSGCSAHKWNLHISRENKDKFCEAHSYLNPCSLPTLEVWRSGVENLLAQYRTVQTFLLLSWRSMEVELLYCLSHSLLRGMFYTQIGNLKIYEHF